MKLINNNLEDSKIFVIQDKLDKFIYSVKKLEVITSEYLKNHLDEINNNEGEFLPLIERLNDKEKAIYLDCLFNLTKDVSLLLINLLEDRNFITSNSITVIKDSNEMDSFMLSYFFSLSTPKELFINVLLFNHLFLYELLSGMDLSFLTQEVFDKIQDLVDILDELTGDGFEIVTLEFKDEYDSIMEKHHEFIDERHELLKNILKDL